MFLRQLRYFVLVAEKLHMGRASEELGIAPSALSQHIRALEQRLGVKLFHRRNRRIELTDAGAAYLREVRITLAQAEYAEQVARRVDRGDMGELRIGYIGSGLLEPRASDLIRRFMHKHPETKLSLHEGDLRSQMSTILRLERELAIVRLPLPEMPPELIVEFLCKDRLCAVMPATHPLAELNEVSAHDIATYNHIGLRDVPGTGIVHAMKAISKNSNVSLNKNILVNSTSDVFGMVHAGLGLAVVPESFRKIPWPDLEFRTIVDFTPQKTYPTIDTFILRHRSRSSSLCDAFLETARDTNAEAS